MSSGEDQSLAQYWSDVPAADRDEQQWLQGPRISADDLAEGSARVERLSSAAWWRAAAAEDRQNNRQSAVPSVAQQPRFQPRIEVMRIGKHAGKPLSVIQDEDPGYFAWACRDMAGFEEKARKAGLLDD